MPGLDQEIDMLRKIPMFAKLNATKLKLLAFTSELVHYNPDDVIFLKGDRADCAYVIMEGQVDIITETETGPVVAATLVENQLFGELALFNGAPRNATLKAANNLTVMKISEEMFLQLLSENADMALEVMRQLSTKLDKSHQQVEILQQELEQHNLAAH